MTWFNYYGLIFVVIILIPNIIFTVKNKNALDFPYKNKRAEVFEQIGRYGCMFFIVFNVPYTTVGFYFPFAEAVYVAVNGALVLAYCLVWLILRNKSGIVKSLLLSVIPSVLFLFSGIIVASIPLTVFALIFAVTHILISVKNAIPCETSGNIKRKSALTVISVLLAFILTVTCAIGGVAAYGQSSMAKLDGMSVMDMIKYDCSDKHAKISVALIENGQVTYRVYGADGEESKIYDYEIGSISKTFVGLMCAKAVDEGKLKLSDSISQYLDLEENKYYPTIERLLTHTSGYEAYYFESKMIGNKLAGISNDYYGTDKERILDRVKNVKLEDKDYPFVYSNFGISVLGLVLEKIYNGDFADIMNGFIRSELKLVNTEVAKQSGNLGNYWMWNADDGYIPAGAIISNIEDAASYLNTYLTDGLDYATITYGKIKTVNANNAPYEKLNIRMDSVGMTWILDDKNDIVWHNGGTSGFNSYMGFTKDKQKGVVVLSNLGPNDRISVTVIGAKILTDADGFNLLTR